MNRSILLVCVQIIFSCLWMGPMEAVAKSETEKITVRLVEIQGNQRIEDSTIRAKIKLQDGDPFDYQRIQEDIRSIYQLGYFDEVHVRSEGFEGGVKIIYVLVERPFISEIRFEGYDAVTLEDLKEQIHLKEENFLDRQQLKSDVDQLIKLFEEEGYSSARIVPVVKVLDADRVSVLFWIEEGKKFQVKEIRFSGIDAFSESEIKGVLATTEYFWLTSWLTESGLYKEDQILVDAERIRDLYLNNGYLEVQVGEALVEEDREKASFILTFPIVEGEQYTIREIAFKGNKVFGASHLKTQVKSIEGELFRRNILRGDVAVLNEVYGAVGYAFSEIFPQIQPDPNSQKVDIFFDVKEGLPVKIRRINIVGNTKTRDKVIRREIRIDEQGLINTKALRRSHQRLNNLNFFETIELFPERISDDQMDLNIRVKEKSTGSFSVGGGFSSVDQLVGVFELSQGNLFGRGHLLRVKAELGSRRNTFSLTFKEPYLLDYPVSLTTDIFKLTRNFNTYNEKRTGANLIFGKSFSEFVSGSFSYTYETVELFNVREGLISLIRNQEGEQTTSSVGMRLTYDSRDNFFDTHSGMRHFISIEVAEAGLGGSNKFYKLIGDVSKFFPLWWDTVFLVHGRIGYATGFGGKELPLGERFYVGGINTIRGFDFGKAGPIDSSTGQIIGADNELIFNFEYILPLVREANIKGVLFFDAGRGYDSGGFASNESLLDFGLRISAGFGIRWISPVGPLRLEWGFNLNPRGNERSKNVEFSIGSLF